MEFLTLFGTILKLGAGFAKMKAEMDAGMANLAELQSQARLEDAMGVDALRRGSVLAGRVRMKGTMAAAEQATLYGASGVDSTTGTPVQAMDSAQLMNEHDAMLVENNAYREAWGHQMKAQQTRRQYANEASRLNNAQWGAALEMGGTMLGGAANMVGGG